MNFLKRLRISVVVLALLAAAATGGCAHSAVREEGGAAAGASGASAAAAASGAAEVYGPEAPLGPMPAPGYVPPKEGYVLVFGPGLARALAYVGVLRELEARNQPIHAVVGVEMGAVIGGIWASSNSNNLEWEMHKFKRDTLLDLSVFSIGEQVAEGRKLYAFLDEAIKVAQLQQMKVMTVVASATPNSEAILAESNGSAKDIIRGAMGIPGLIKPYSWEARERESAALEQPFPVAVAKKSGLGKVVCVDVLGRGDNFKPKDAVDSQLATLMRSVSALARSELKDCEAVISIPMDDVSYLDFEDRADLISRGREAVRKWLEPAKP